MPLTASILNAAAALLGLWLALAAAVAGFEAIRQRDPMIAAAGGVIAVLAIVALEAPGVV